MIYKSYLLEQNINNLNENLYLFYGENLGLKNDFKDLLISRGKGSEIIKLNQDDILKKEEFFFNEINNISLFEKKKIYFIEQVNDKILDIIQEVEPRLDTQKLYLFSDILDRKSKIRNYFEKSATCGSIACYVDNEISLKKIILERLNGFEGLTTNVINLIINNCNLDRSKLNNEIKKIHTYFINKKIDREKLEILLNIKTNDNFSFLKDEALNGNKIKTNQLLSNTIIDVEKNIFYLNLINQRLNRLVEISNLSRSFGLEDAFSKIKPPIFWKEKPNFLIQIKKWNLKKIQTILSKTYDLEIKIKSDGAVNKNILMKKLLVDICELANAS
jgi:DNA polymerase-3 subunit delta